MKACLPVIMGCLIAFSLLTGAHAQVEEIDYSEYAGKNSFING